MVGPIKTRLACDRCHGQKLRCPKQAGSRVCTRCERAGVACAFSPIGGIVGGGVGGEGSTQSGQSVVDGMGFPLPSSMLGGGGSGGDREDWAMPSFSDDSGGGVGGAGGAGSAGSEAGIAGFSFDDLMRMTATADGPLFTDSSNGLFPRMLGDGTGTMPAATAATAAAASTGSTDSNDSNGPATAYDNSHKNGTATNSTLTQRLAKLVVDADLLYSALPAESSMHAPLCGGGDNTQPLLDDMRRLDYPPAKFAQKEFLERVFDITQRLSNAYAEAALAAEDDGDNEDDEKNLSCQADNCLHSVPLPGNLSACEAAFHASGLAAPPRRRRAKLDLTATSLLVAAHTRLLDVLVRIVQGIFTCYKVRVATATLDVAEMQLPDLTIGGSFVPPKGSAALVHAFLLRHMLNSLQEGIERYLEALRGKDNADEPNPSMANRELHIATLQLAVLKERHDAMLHHLVAVGTDLAKTGLIR